MTLSSRLLRFAVPMALLLPAAPAVAQEEGWIVDAGPGIAFRPAFPGADKLEPQPWPLIDVYRPGRGPAFETPDQSFGFGIVGGDRLRIGPALRIDGGRDEEDAILGIGNVGTTIEGGAFAEAYVSPSVRLRGEVRKGFGGHKGVVGDVGADVIMGSPQTLHMSIGPRARFANGRYVRAFFGINPEQSTLTGLPAYNVDGGLHSAGALAFASYRLSSHWGIEAYARYDRLLGDAKDSPLVLSEVGSRDQFEAGVGLSYRFSVR